MSRSHRVMISLGIVAATILAMFGDAAVHFAAAVGIGANLIWIWDDEIDTYLKRRLHLKSIANDNKERRNDGKQAA